MNGENGFDLVKTRKHILTSLAKHAEDVDFGRFIKDAYVALLQKLLKESSGLMNFNLNGHHVYQDSIYGNFSIQVHGIFDIQDYEDIDELVKAITSKYKENKEN